MLSADGCVDTLVPEEIGCCPPPLCGNDLCCTFVAFFNLLPSGPMWDYWKNIAISYFESDADPAECPLVQDPNCPSLILHSIYTVLKLRNVVHNALWPAFRESNPYTAITTLDYHLSRLQWEDCYNQHCRSASLGTLSPLEIMTVCGPTFCPPNYPPELENALKHAIVVSLSRANMGVIKNLCGLNWIIAPLGVELVPIYLPPPGEPPPEDCVDPPDPVPLFPEQTLPCDDVTDEPCYAEPTANCDPHNCGNTAFELRPTQDWLPGLGTGDVCEQLPPPQIPASWDWGCDKPAGLPDTVWPGVLAAECIIRSLLHCPTDIRRAC